MDQDSIVLDVSKGDFDDHLPRQERWQRQAESTLRRALEESAVSAKRYKQSRMLRPFIQAIHDAIFVAAPRGAGKTIFLRNAKNIWADARASKPDLPSLHFCPEIDPTLLVNKDNFANVVIAHLYNEVECKLRHNNNQSVSESDHFYQALSVLADALGHSEFTSDELTGIDRIVSYRSGIQLESHFHAFVEQCIKILNVDAIILPIDDVDMALGRAFEVLDVVRRLLGCPYIIPLVSGHKALYQPIVHEHFLYGGDQNKRRELLTSDDAGDLADAYLTKLFPLHLRVNLLSLEDITHQLFVRESGIVEDLPISKYYETLGQALSPLVNGEEKSREWPHPQTARQVAQLCQHFPPKLLANIDGKKNRDFWYTYQTLAEARHHGAAFLTAQAEQNILSMRTTEVPTYPFKELAVFNVLKQGMPNAGEWKGKNFFAETKQAIKALKVTVPIEESLSHIVQVLSERPFVKRSMPPLELHISRLSIYKFEEKLKGERSNFPGAVILLGIYSHHAYYGTSLRTVPQIFFGRGFELLATSLLLGKAPSAQSKDGRIIYWRSFIRKLVSDAPFHSAYSIAPTKTIEDEGDDSDVTTPANASETDSVSQWDTGAVELYQINQLANRIAEWEEAYAQVLELAQEDGLINLLSCVFNKTFTQLHLMRVNSGKIFGNDYFTDVVKRFEYILINAFATFINPIKVVQQNIATTQNLQSIRNPTEYASRDPSFRTNVVSFAGHRPDNPIVRSSWVEISEDSKSAKEEDIYSKQRDLLRAIWAHPLFDLAKGTPAIRIGQSPANPTDGMSSRKTLEAVRPIRDQLRKMMPKKEETLMQMPLTEAQRLVRKMRDVCEEGDVDIDDVVKYFAPTGKRMYQALVKISKPILKK